MRNRWCKTILLPIVLLICLSLRGLKLIKSPSLLFKHIFKLIDWFSLNLVALNVFILYISLYFLKSFFETAWIMLSRIWISIALLKRIFLPIVILFLFLFFLAIFTSIIIESFFICSLVWRFFLFHVLVCDMSSLLVWTCIVVRLRKGVFWDTKSSSSSVLFKLIAMWWYIVSWFFQSRMLIVVSCSWLLGRFRLDVVLC